MMDGASSSSGGDPRSGLSAVLQADGFVGISSDFAGIFIPEVIDVGQVMHVAGSLRTSMHVLQLQALLDAIRIILRGALEGRRYRGLYAETHAWFLAHDERDGWPITFRNVCDALELSETHLRRRVLEHVAARRTSASRMRRRVVAGTRTRVSTRREHAACR